MKDGWIPIFIMLLCVMMDGCDTRNRTGQIRDELKAIHETLKQQSTSHPKQDPS